MVGFVGADGAGLAGLEYSLNAQLAGVEGKQTFESAPNGSKIPLGDSSLTPARNGVSYQLSLDSEIQWAAQRRIAEAVKKTRADSGFVVVMDVKTGQVLALAQAPSMDSARPQDADAEDRGNRAISAPYEPGSVQKILTSAALIGLRHREAEHQGGGAEPAQPRAAAAIKDHFSHEDLRYNMRGSHRQLLQHRHRAADPPAEQAAAARLPGQLRSGLTHGIELPGESAGIMPRRHDAQRSARPGGVRPGPVGDRDPGGGRDRRNRQRRRLPPADGAQGGHGRRRERGAARAAPAAAGHLGEEFGAGPGPDAGGDRQSERPAQPQAWRTTQTGGKTGTAQRADTKCHCYKGYVTSFVGFAPLDDPQILTYVVVTNPRKGDTGTTTAAPVYQDVMNMALPRYSVAPDAKPHKPLPTEW